MRQELINKYLLNWINWWRYIPLVGYMDRTILGHTEAEKIAGIQADTTFSQLVWEEQDNIHQRLGGPVKKLCDRTVDPYYKSVNRD